MVGPLFGNGIYLFCQVHGEPVISIFSELFSLQKGATLDIFHCHLKKILDDSADTSLLKTTVNIQ